MSTNKPFKPGNIVTRVDGIGGVRAARLNDRRQLMDTTPIGLLAALAAVAIVGAVIYMVRAMHAESVTRKEQR